MKLNNYSNNWNKINLKDYIETIESGKRPKGGAVSEGIPSLGGEHIDNSGGFKVETDKLKYVPVEFYEKMKSGIIRKGDILVVKDGATTGKVAYVDQEFPLYEACINEHVFLIRTARELDSKYLCYYLRSSLGQRNMMNDFRGATVGGISKDFINFNMLLPPLEAQKKIVEVLEKAEMALEKRKETISLVDELVRSRFIEMFGDPVSNPMEWDKKKLAEECNIITGNTPSRKVDEYYGDYIEWIKSDNITDAGIYLTAAREFLSEEGLRVGRSIGVDSILMTCIAGSIKCIGNVAITNRKVTFNQQINGIEPLKNNVYFMFQQFNLSQKYIQSTINMSLKGILSKGQLSELEFIFPPIEKQNEFAEFFKQIDKLKFEMEESLKELENNFSSLMQSAFKGELIN
ncbi:restriction endonuclease [Clostridium sporogenes]|uniref:restriction endonuclease subunit S n=1 Tax=Clostridium sporogenes TaxID=1509 RepID=UPI0013D7407D|nr:restriction endonuclease subunit S [Clostridium sporogenes]NFM15849.1 restriction endonuclease [Clostridium sporogenes]